MRVQPEKFMTLCNSFLHPGLLPVEPEELTNAHFGSPCLVHVAQVFNVDEVNTFS